MECICISFVVVIVCMIIFKMSIKNYKHVKVRRGDNNIKSLSSNSDSLCLSLIIPSTIQDLNRCSSILQRSLCNSTKYPDEVVLVISGVLSENIPKLTLLTEGIKKCTKNLIIKYRKNLHNAASNRNYGYLHSNCPILSYFDADDIMSKYRISIIHKIYNENKNIDVVFHPSIKNYKILDKVNLLKRYKRYSVVDKFELITNRCRKTFSYDGRIHNCDVSNGFYITNGWPSIKRSVMDKIRFNESLRSTEDLDFIARVVEKGYKVAIFKRPLGFYIKDFNCIAD